VLGLELGQGLEQGLELGLGNRVRLARVRLALDTS